MSIYFLSHDKPHLLYLDILYGDMVCMTVSLRDTLQPIVIISCGHMKTPRPINIKQGKTTNPNNSFFSEKKKELLGLCMYVCMYVCMCTYVCMYVCVCYVCVCMCMYVYVCVYMYICMYVYMYICGTRTHDTLLARQML